MHLVVEEKLDGANSGISFSIDGDLRLQSRGHFLVGGYRERHFALLKTWANAHRAALWELLGTRYRWTSGARTGGAPIVPALWFQTTFVAKGGPEIVGQMYAFEDKKGRPICLIPEVTGPLQELWNRSWSRQGNTKRIFYVARCYRYASPPLGRSSTRSRLRRTCPPCAGSWLVPPLTRRGTGAMSQLALAWCLLVTGRKAWS